MYRDFKPMVFLIENNGARQVRPVREEAEEKDGGDERGHDGGDGRGDDNFPRDFNDENNPELFDVPSLRCGRCNLIVFLGGRNYERNHQLV